MLRKQDEKWLYLDIYIRYGEKIGKRTIAYMIILG